VTRVRIGTIIALVLLIGLQTVAAETSGPHILPLQSTIDFGTVTEGTTVERSFPLKNSGTEPLTLTRIVSSCGCVVLDQNGVVIPAGETHPLKVLLNTQGSQGQRSRVIRVFSNDSEKPVVSLNLSGTVEPLVTILPERVKFSPLFSYGSSLEQRTSVVEVKPKTVSNEKWEKIEAVSLSPFILLKTLEKNASLYRFQVAVSEEVPLGTLRSRIVLKSSEQKSTTQNIPVVANIKHPLAFTPRLVRETVAGDGINRREVTISNRGSLPILITGVRTQHSFIQTKLSEITQGREYKLVIEFDGSEISESIRDTVSLETEVDIPNLPVLEVHVIVPPSIE
jgi:hypothetical protein